MTKNLKKQIEDLKDDLRFLRWKQTIQPDDFEKEQIEEIKLLIEELEQKLKGENK